MPRIHCTSIQLCEILTFYQSQGSRSDFPLIMFGALKSVSIDIKKAIMVATSRDG